MQSKTRQAALSIREAFLALPDDLLLAKVLSWAEGLDPDGEGWDLNPDYLALLGYQVRSNATGTVYASLDDLWESEEDTDVWTSLPPTPATIRQAISALSSDDVYHLLVGYLGEVLRGQPLTEVWGEPPASDERGGGSSFMTYCAIYLRALAGQAHPRTPREGKLIKPARLCCHAGVPGQRGRL